MNAIARSWQYAAAAVTLGVALPVLWGDVFLVSYGARVLGIAASILP